MPVDAVLVHTSDSSSCHHLKDDSSVAKKKSEKMAVER
jgi:hypothetical protein